MNFPTGCLPKKNCTAQNHNKGYKLLLIQDFKLIAEEGISLDPNTELVLLWVQKAVLWD